MLRVLKAFAESTAVFFIILLLFLFFVWGAYFLFGGMVVDFWTAMQEGFSGFSYGSTGEGFLAHLLVVVILVVVSFSFGGISSSVSDVGFFWKKVFHLFWATLPYVVGAFLLSDFDLHQGSLSMGFRVGNWINMTFGFFVAMVIIFSIEGVVRFLKVLFIPPKRYRL